MEIYGLLGVTHAAQRVLTVMSPAGAGAALEHVRPTEDVIVDAAAGHLTRYLEKRAGALDRIIARHGIQILSKADWDARKRSLGEAIW